ncbi:recombinase family protein [Georgenia daeguensis]|uniref:recombinase family protein n=1 Tax=Georgenia daeguensis TaxID=908355 RepID=UPI003CD066C7
MSTTDQDALLQFAALRSAGVEEVRIITDHCSGASAERPGLTGLLEQLQPGDVLTVWKLDRLGRSVSHLVSLVDDLGRRGVEFRSLTEALDTTTPGGRLLFHVVAAVAQFERELIVERTRAALAAARAQNRQLGRPSRVNEHQFRLIHQMAEVGTTHAVIAASTGLSKAVVGRVLRGEIASLAHFSRDTDGALPLYEEPSL